MLAGRRRCTGRLGTSAHCAARAACNSSTGGRCLVQVQQAHVRAHQLELVNEGHACRPAGTEGRRGKEQDAIFPSSTPAHGCTLGVILAMARGLPPSGHVNSRPTAPPPVAPPFLLQKLTGGVLGHEPHQEPHHHPAAVADLVLARPAKHPAAGGCVETAGEAAEAASPGSLAVQPFTYVTAGASDASVGSQ